MIQRCHTNLDTFNAYFFENYVTFAQDVEFAWRVLDSISFVDSLRCTIHWQDRLVNLLYYIASVPSETFRTYYPCTQTKKSFTALKAPFYLKGRGKFDPCGSLIKTLSG
jgi:hypothetical protein